MLEWLGLIPLLGLTGNWRGYRMGGKAIGGANMSTDTKKKFEAARAAGNMDQAQAIADKAQSAKDAKKAEKSKTIAKDSISPLKKQLIDSNNSNVIAAYNGKIVDMGYITKGIDGKPPTKKQLKEQFRFAAMRISDNIPVSGVGVVKDPDGAMFIVSRANRSAKPISMEDLNLLDI